MQSMATQHEAAEDNLTGPDATFQRARRRRDSSSQHSETSQTAVDFIREQEQLEADAREVLPYSIDSCTNTLGPLRQPLFACLTCNPPPANPSERYQGAGVCYACSVQCHGEHTLVELFAKRNFTCDCGTTRLPASSPCSLRVDAETGTKGGVRSEEPDANNQYNHNFRNRFCGCACDYDPFEQKGTMFQCLGLGTEETGGCGEDWWHPGCLVGLGPKWFEKMAESDRVKAEDERPSADGALATIDEDTEGLAQASGGDNAQEQAATAEEEDDVPPPPGFPREDDFEGFICYKCVEAFPWIKRYAGAPGFLPPVFAEQQTAEAEASAGKDGAATTQDQTVKQRNQDGPDGNASANPEEKTASALDEPCKKRKPSGKDGSDAQPSKRPKAYDESLATPPFSNPAPQRCKLPNAAAPTSRFSLFFHHDSFRLHFCRCPSCFPLLKPHPQLLEDEETYEPPVSDDGQTSQHSGNSLLELGESALRNVDRVRAIEGVLAYNQLKNKLKPFFQQFAESGQAISADDIKEYFAKLRGDDEGMRQAGAAAKGFERQEQEGY